MTRRGAEVMPTALNGTTLSLISVAIAENHPVVAPMAVHHFPRSDSVRSALARLLPEQ